PTLPALEVAVPDAGASAVPRHRARAVPAGRRRRVHRLGRPRPPARLRRTVQLPAHLPGRHQHQGAHQHLLVRWRVADRPATDWDGLDPQLDFVGLFNFQLIFQDATNMRALINTFVYAGVSTIAENVIGLLIALGLHSRIKSRNVLRVAFFMPVVLLSVVVAFLWRFLFQPTTGALTQLIRSLGFADADPNWLGDPNLVVFSISIIVIWQFSGYTMLIYLAGLQGVPAEPTEAAPLDGAGAIKRFWHAVLPML